MKINCWTLRLWPGIILQGWHDSNTHPDSSKDLGAI